ncbi:Phototropin-2 (Non-phototropic hypocotyl protein 1B) (OsNPH1B) [Durusdinium trenchii]|uniref:Phototropin-2 (Non-phototropic hypocotyl protein 1B) (OsNPH1B) n=1 Tax=Durusdinium trenchii TaxID=1381693 RepID=A0ABP0S9I2_9DINO
MTFSFTIADPRMSGCPLIGCSTGFGTLCGYTMDDIVGRNCRFLVDPVPRDKVDWKMRRHAKDFCEAVRVGKQFRIPDKEREEWMPIGRAGDELFCYQVNARKDGSLFNNMFYMKAWFTYEKSKSQQSWQRSCDGIRDPFMVSFFDRRPVLSMS